jgi:hypothetical protein
MSEKLWDVESAEQKRGNEYTSTRVFAPSSLISLIGSGSLRLFKVSLLGSASSQIMRQHQQNPSTS